MTVTAMGLKSDEAALKTISQDIADVTTPDYKRQVSPTPAFVQPFDQLSGPVASPSMHASTVIDGTVGVLRNTGEIPDVSSS